MVLSRKRIVLAIVVALVMAFTLTMWGPGQVGPGPAFAPGEVPKVNCNAGNGNGNEGCDPGNSAPQNKGGDEVVTPPFNSSENPGGNNV